MASPRKRRERKAAAAAEAQVADAPKAVAPKAEAPKAKETQETAKVVRAEKTEAQNPTKTPKQRINFLGNKND